MPDTMKTLAVCAGGAAVGFLASGGNPLGAVAGCLIPMATGCGGSETDVGTCIDPLAIPPPEPDQGEKLYSDGNNYVLVDERLGEETAKFYLDALPQQAQRVLDFFGIDSPWRRSMTMILVEHDSVNNTCRPGHNCASGGAIIMHFSSAEEGLFSSESIRTGHIWNEETFVHEMSHAVRSNVAHPWTGLEEGLATYTAQELVVRQTIRQPRGHAQKIYEGNILVGETVLFPEEIDIEKMTLVSFDESFATFTLDRRPSRRGEPQQVTLVIPFNVYRSSGDNSFLFYAEKRDPLESGLMVKMYQRGNEYIEEGNNSVNRLSDIISSNMHCAEEGYYSTQMIMTNEGPVAVEGRLSPYTQPENFSYENFHEAHGDYTTEFCFWDRIRENHGHSAVIAIVQSMVEFSQEHPSLPANTEFPFFQTFLDVTGMDKESAKAYFDLYSAPIEDSWYHGGGVCWDE